MVELRRHFTVEGFTNRRDGVAPNNHAEHETIEIIHGFNTWFEAGFHIFTSARSGDGGDRVGDHIRPRVRRAGHSSDRGVRGGLRADG